MRLGELLIEAGAIDNAQLDVALRSQKQFGGRLGTNLVELGFLTEAMLTKVLAAQLHLPRAGENALENIPRAVLDLIPSQHAAQLNLCPVRQDGRRLHVAMSDPLDKAAIDTLSVLTGYDVRPLVAGDGLIRHALQKHYGVNPRARVINVGSGNAVQNVPPASTAVAAIPIASGDVPAVFEPYAPFAPLAHDPRVVSLDGIPSPAVDDSRVQLLAQQLLECKNPDEIADAVLRFVAKDFARALLLHVRAEKLVGTRAYGEGLGQRAFTTPLTSVPLFEEAIRDGLPRVGSQSDSLAAFAPLLGDLTQQATIMFPLRHRNRAIGCVVGAGGSKGVQERIVEYRAIAKKVELAFEMIQIRRQILG